MNDLSALNVDCAIAMGYRSDGKGGIGGLGIGDAIPSYVDDYNDARLLEDEIERRGLVKEYIFALDKLVTYPAEESWQGYRWGILRATPEQRARAFLTAVGA